MIRRRKGVKGDLNGWATALGVCLTLGLLTVVLIWPFGETQVVEGEIVKIGLVEMDESSHAVAYVEADGATGRVRLHRGEDCSEGDEVQLTLRPHWSGLRLERSGSSKLCDD